VATRTVHIAVTYLNIQNIQSNINICSVSIIERYLQYISQLHVSACFYGAIFRL